jgi:hypothetical protein
MPATAKSAAGPRGGAPVPSDPIADAVDRGDYDLFRQVLADDVVFRSPVSRFRFRGPEITSALFERLVKQSDRERWGVQNAWALGDGMHAVSLTTNVRGHQLDLLIVTELNERFQIREVTVYARPMASIAIFPAFVYPHLVELFRSPRRAALVRLMFRPLPRLLKAFTSAGLGFGQPPQAEFEEIELPKRDQPQAPAAAANGPSDAPAPSGGAKAESGGGQAPPDGAEAPSDGAKSASTPAPSEGPRSPFRRS